MKPLKFQIKNYKSIVDSGVCFFEKGYTILAGKNESGKTTILEALNDFDENRKISSEAIPIGETQKVPEISIWFETNNDEIEEAKNKVISDLKLTDYEISHQISLRKANVIKITKMYNESNYSFISDIKLNQKVLFPEFFEKNLAEKLTEVAIFYPEMAKEKYSKDIKYLKEFFEKKLDKVNKAISNTNTDNSILLDAQQMSVLLSIETFVNEFEAHKDLTESFYDYLLKNYMPYFILFSTFDDTVPDKLTIEEIHENVFAKDLEVISEFRISNIIEKNRQIQTNSVLKINSNFTNIFKSYWTQDEIKLQVEKDGDIVYFWIEENGIRYKPSQRSKGQQWFLSFYIKVVSRMQEDIPNVILIDEPGLYLHAKAQKDMLTTLENQFVNNLIVFSTHSPYLISENKLNNIRLVEKYNNITKIHNKSWSKIRDKETLTPILTAIGLSVGDSIDNRNGKRNIICEGMEDVFYLRAFQSAIKNDDQLNFINGDGADKVQFIYRILDAWGCDVKFLFDNDNAGKKASNRLQKTELIETKNIIFVSDNENSCTVDLLSLDDFKKYVVPDFQTKINKNSEYFKDKVKDKPLLARTFLKEIDNITLDSESIENISNLFEKLKFDI
ncbi:AAA family ATPase [Enterococcus sulfureus]